MTDASPTLALINREIAPYTAIHLHGAYGSIGVTDAFTVQGAIRVGSPAQAGQIVADAQKQLDEWAAQSVTGRYFDQLDVACDGTDVLVDAKVNLLQLISARAAGLVNVEVDVKKAGS